MTTAALIGAVSQDHEASPREVEVVDRLIEALIEVERLAAELEAFHGNT